MKQEVPMKWVLVGALAIAVIVGLFIVIRGGSQPQTPKEAGLGAPALPGGGTLPVDPKTNLPYPPGQEPKTETPAGPSGPTGN